MSLRVLAERAVMSERSFSRAFHREVGQTPAAYVEALRIERARDLLQDGAPSLQAVPNRPDSPAPKSSAKRFTATSASHPPNTATGSS
ncbi:MAG: helix-turn-helix domain-containing protein [Solirubrobacteraceae bacterium]